MGSFKESTLSAPDDRSITDMIKTSLSPAAPGKATLAIHKNDKKHQ